MNLVLFFVIIFTGDNMLNKEQYKALKKLIKIIKTKYPDTSIISNWVTGSLNISKEHRQILQTIQFSSPDNVAEKFKWAFGGGDVIRIDPNIINSMNEYEAKHNWKTSTVVILTVLGTLVGIAVGILSVIL